MTDQHKIPISYGISRAPYKGRWPYYAMLGPDQDHSLAKPVVTRVLALVVMDKRAVHKTRPIYTVKWLSHTGEVRERVPCSSPLAVVEELHRGGCDFAIDIM